ncbi:hypothetical protein DPMN_133503 [Dreissena polymorpha]|uniref:B box-type domain-containing protein n=1 Tax=Dreissena polymorpha TaxID=45954 RepID=A0A9D4J9U7_DREPO|nr:hypothetical protein DPMN_133503 [Dreissena polymorpha]
MECSLNECGVCGSESVAAFCENCNFRICKNCFHVHKKSTKLFKNHRAFLIETTQPILGQGFAGHNSRKVSKHSSGDIHTHKCATHATENLAFFCSDHSDTLCGRCVVSCHKLCKIVDLFEVNIDDEEVTACKSHLHDLAEKFKRAANKIDQNTTDNKTCKQEFLKELQQLRIDVNTWFDCLQSKCEKQYSETFETNTERLTRVRTSCNELEKRIEDHQELIDSLLTQNHVKKLYVVLNKMKQEIVEINSKLTWLDTESSFTELNFKRSSGIHKLLNDKMFDIGGLEESCSGSDEISEGPLSSITVSGRKEHTNIIFISSDKIILSNRLSDLKLICCTQYVLGFKEGSRMGAQFKRQYDCNGKDLQIWTLRGNAGTEEQDKKHGQKRS